jgi:hypothetical protein
MEKKDEQFILKRLSVPQPSSDDLRGRQSVRATFKLSARAIEALSIVAVHLGIKQKSLFDHLIEDADTLDTIARQIEAKEFSELDRVQKTFVISRRTLACLEQTSKQFKTPRDALVEYSIQRLLPIIARERRKHRRRKEALAKLENHFRRGLELLQALRDELGKEDPLSMRLEQVMAGYASARDAMREFVQRGEIIEKF